ncbi:organic solute transporter Ostalpha-domain-containing protein [Xylariaceae sp. FL1272]|nr:organic solute transporter Ostalpha-domain-containing protein [Xylariaceae sp. FL1272]
MIENIYGSVLASRAVKTKTCSISNPLNPVPTEPIAGSYDFYHINTIVSGIFAILSILITFALIVRHATHISKPRQQLQIIHICLFIPIFAIALWLSVYIPRTYVYADAVVNMTEPIAVTCFYFFICEIISQSVYPTNPTPSFRDIFLSPLVAHAINNNQPRIGEQPQMSVKRYKLLNLYVLQGIPASVLIGVLMIITQALDVYCLTSHDGQHAHLVLLIFRGTFTTFLLIAIVRTVVPHKAELRRQNAQAITKLFVFKALIFFQTTQSFAFGILASVNPPSVRNSKTLSEADWLIGIPSLLTEIELLFFALFFHYAYGIRLYQLSDSQRAAGEEYISYGWRIIPEVLYIRELPAFWKFWKNLRSEVEAYERENEPRQVDDAAKGNERHSRNSSELSMSETVDPTATSR